MSNIVPRFPKSYFASLCLGPENWHKNFPVAAGENQSPINIDTHDVLYDPYLGDINFYGYHSNDEFLNYRLRNTGFAVKVEKLLALIHTKE